MSEQSSARGGWQADRTTFQRVYDLVVGTTSAAPAASYAERADCSETGARQALEQLTEMGIAERTEGRPAQYRRNPSYFRWKRVEDLARDHSVSTLKERVDDLLDRDRAYQDEYDAPDPDSVATDDGIEDHERLHERWDDLGEWRTIRRDIGVLKQAVQRAESRRDDRARA
jgi:predicted ArsR family transcriptional regulator